MDRWGRSLTHIYNLTYFPIISHPYSFIPLSFASGRKVTISVLVQRGQLMACGHTLSHWQTLAE